MHYRDDKGQTLYGFSQENLEKTNRQIRQTNKLLLLLIFLVLLFLIAVVFSAIYLDYNNIITRLIYGG
ncbi:hypothetical protein COV22_00555 [Candidatus Woesearchaeota archaeon CG10_big_fil_rev_8_21_14_0_10_47_5]|nr:MAG: hypothetical protein COV22_00555 [Candidatus Woesearchaeota archaeon CG10_big_fil_rev_8_21_14_0_10_47_5]